MRSRRSPFIYWLCVQRVGEPLAVSIGVRESQCRIWRPEHLLSLHQKKFCLRVCISHHKMLITAPGALHAQIATPGRD